ncbi:unnamed protein product [Brassicogethes aeneus]|uniref:Chitin-binding type-4 domain-containing protein n=1 Tax=Brassicogethes aeneus TaxID=1431903 RepID=A0A9P0AWF9_BRAAE|nr:unnamed protein product [Brassicogethes aeneus]
MSQVSALSLVFLLFGFIYGINGHGMMLEPPNRSSLWRFDETSVKNYDDNANFCGGFSYQWELNDGKCGVCGDPVNEPHPQRNENTGIFGQGKVVRTYESGSVINISILITANHLGDFSYSLCKLEDPNAPESGEECFQPLKFANGSDIFQIYPLDFHVENQVVLPENITCDRCVLRWHYHTGNSWGVCEDGSGADGCGPQEVFRSCSDIAIV